MAGSVLMVQGTTSGAGKSLLVTALCRVYARRGVRVAPFKCQNMSLNSFATPGGGEIGRSQALQAAAAGVAPHVDMNPILLKPAGRRGCQLVVLGRPRGHHQAIAYEHLHGDLFPLAMSALDRLRAAHDLVIAEGSGSPAEINLRGKDIANMAVARHAACPVLLVADIDRGGVFASLAGTMHLLAREERDLVAGLVINRMRGDAAVLDTGLAELTRHTGKPVVGVVPFLPDLDLEDEDSLDLDGRGPAGAADALRVAVVRFPHISNFTDFQVLEREPGVSVQYVDRADALAGVHVVILPGSKETLADLAWLRARGLAEAVIAHHRAGGHVLGICGGLQMLGAVLRDETAADQPVPGLGLLPVETAFGPEKRTVQATGTSLPGYLDIPGDLPLTGYEIHMGRTSLTGGAPFARLTAADGGRYEEGAVSADGLVAGTYLHGLFDADDYRRAWVAAARRHAGLGPVASDTSADAAREAAIDRAADAVEAALDMAAINALVNR